MVAGLGVIVAATSVLWTEPPAQPDQHESGLREVDIAVTVRAADGSVVPDLIVALDDARDEDVFVQTDERGVAHIKGKVTQEGASVSLWLCQWKPDGDYDQNVIARDVYGAAIRASHFPDRIRALIGSNETAAEIVLQGSDCISITLGTPMTEPRVKVWVHCSETAEQVRGDTMRSSEVTLRGVKKGAPALLTVSRLVSTAVTVIELDADDTLSDRSIKDVTAPNDQDWGEVDLVIVDRALIPPASKYPYPITLISDDAARCHVCLAQGGERGFCIRGNTTLLRLQPGRYAVAPGALGLDRGPAALYGYIKKNRAFPAGVPTIEVVAEGKNEFRVECVPVLEALAKLPDFPGKESPHPEVAPPK